MAGYRHSCDLLEIEWNSGRSMQSEVQEGDHKQEASESGKIFRPNNSRRIQLQRVGVLATILVGPTTWLLSRYS